MTSSVMPEGVEQQSPPAPRGELGHLDLSRIAQDLQIRKVQVEAVVQLLDEENTIPFIAHHTHSSRPPFSPPASTTAALALITAAEYALSIAIAFPF